MKIDIHELEALVDQAQEPSVPMHLVKPRDWQAIVAIEAARLPDGPERAAKIAESRRYQACADMTETLAASCLSEARRAQAAESRVQTLLQRLQEVRTQLTGSAAALAVIDELTGALPAQQAVTIPAPLSLEVFDEEVTSFDAG